MGEAAWSAASLHPELGRLLLGRTLRRGRELVGPADTGPAEVLAAGSLDAGGKLERFATTFPAVDALLGGGWRRRELAEVVGRRSSGRFGLVLATLAAATARGEAAALIDLGDHFDPHHAETAGVVLERLLWLRPRQTKPALMCAEIALTGGFPLVVIDLGLPPVPGGRGNEAGWLRLRRAAQAHDAALLIATPYRVSGTAAQLVLELQRPRRDGVFWLGAGDAGWRAQPRPLPSPLHPSLHQPLLHGLHAEAALTKIRGARGARARPQVPAPFTLCFAPGSLAEPLAPPRAPSRRPDHRPTAAIAPVHRFPPPPAAAPADTAPADTNAAVVSSQASASSASSAAAWAEAG